MYSSTAPFITGLTRVSERIFRLGTSIKRELASIVRLHFGSDDFWEATTVQLACQVVSVMDFLRRFLIEMLTKN